MTSPIGRHAPLLAAALVVIAVLAIVSSAGDLDPPVGPVAPTMKALDQVEPRTPINSANTPGDADALFVITAPGSYYLEGPIEGTPGLDGIRITTPNVTIDGMGFPMTLEDGEVLDIAVSTLGNPNIVIRNLIARGWPVRGSDGARLESLVVEDTQTSAIATGNNSVVRDCTVRASAGSGVETGDGCVIADCAVSDGTGSGYSLGEGCTVTNCSARNNASHGFSGNRDNTITGCSATGNGGDGFRAFNGVTTMTACTAAHNTGFGIRVSGVGSTVTGCTSTANAAGQIDVGSQSYIARNTCRGSGNAPGIVVGGDSNRIEENLVTFLANPAYDIQGSGNLIVRNYASNNVTNFTIASGNIVGSVITLPAGGNITPSLNTTPWTNFAN